MHYLLILNLLAAVSKAALIVDYNAPGPVSDLGSPQLESTPWQFEDSHDADSHAYIRPQHDPDGKPALHYHRDPSYRRAEVKAKGKYEPNKNYFVGYEFRLSNIHEHLALFQWKKNSKTAKPIQNIPFNIQFKEEEPTRLSIAYQSPGEDDAAPYQTIWTSDSDFSTNQTHNIALSWDTSTQKSNKLQVWFDGKSVLQKSGLKLWTGATYPKFGIYRGEQGDHDGGGHSNDFDLWVYRVQISDESLDEIADSSGLQGSHVEERGT